jgi:hypothetical protein
MADNSIYNAEPFEAPASQKITQSFWRGLAPVHGRLLQRYGFALILTVGVGVFVGGAALIIKNTRHEQTQAMGDNEAKVRESEQKLKEYLEKEEKQYYLRFPFFRIPSLNIPVIQNDTLIGILNIKLEIEATDKNAFEMSRVVLPIIVDRIFCDLYAAFGMLWIPSLAPKMDVIKTYVKRAVRKVVGANKIKNVYIRQFYIERKVGF